MILHRKRARLWLALSALLLAVLLCGCGKGAESESYTSPEDLRGKRIGCLTGGSTGTLLEEYYNGEAEICYFNANADMSEALAADKIDAYCTDNVVAEQQCRLYPGQTMLSAPLRECDVAFFFPQDDPDAEALRAQLNEYLAQITEDGTLARLHELWYGEAEEQKVIDTALSGENGTLTLACSTGIGYPFCYLSEDSFVGFDIDLAYHFCREYGYALELMDCDFAGMLAAVSAGKADFGGTHVSVTEERAQSVDFADAHDTLTFNLVVNSASAKSESYTSPEDLRGKRVAVVTGSVTEKMLAEYYGDEVEVSYFNSNADMAAALDAGKVDAYLACAVDARLQCETYTDQHSLAEELKSLPIAYYVPKTDDGAALCAEMDEFLAALDESGEMAAIYEKWETMGEEAPTLDTELSGEKGTLTMACCTNMGQPQCFVQNNQIVGCDIEYAYLFCREYGYALELMDCDFGGMLAAVTSGKADFAGSGIGVTEERAEVALFSRPTHYNAFVLTVKDNSAAETGGFGSFINRLRESFVKTFITENRWKMFLSGLGVTLLITVLSILFGTMLGYAVYMACRSGSKIINKLTDAFTWLINGMPIVVLLMLLFYVIFGSSSLSGMWVSVIAYTIVFAVGFTAMLRQSVDSIDPGQLEAAYALGYTKASAFTKRILPQAIRRLLPAYKAQAVTTIKSTAIVGYIAVQDLTKAGDIVRSRTFEAFFPILSTAVLYFLLAAILSVIVKNIQLNFDPRRRSHEKILRGVEK